MKKLGVILSILFVFGFSLLTTNRVFAVSDLTYTITSSNSSLTLCGSGSSYTCSDYSYLTLETDIEWETNSRTYAIQYSIRDGGSLSNVQRNVIYNFPGVLSFDIPSNVEQIQTWAINSIPSGSSFTITLSESPAGGGIIPTGTLDITSNGTYDVTNYASATVDVSNSSFIVDLFSKGFWGVATAIVSLIVPVFALFLVFRLVHDFFWGRG